MKAFLAVTFLSCVPANSPGIAWHPGDTYQMQDPNDLFADEAAADWMTNVKELSVTFFPKLPVGGCISCVAYVPGTQASCKEACFNQHSNFGCTYELPFLTNDSSVMIAQDISDDQKRWIWRHEMGHEFGLLHTGPGTVMYPLFVGSSHAVTATDAKQYESLRGR